MRICGYQFREDYPVEQTRLHGYAHHCTHALDGGEMHFHPYSEILFVLDGAGVFTQGNAEVRIRRGSLVIINPYSSHAERAISESVPLDCVFFTLDDFKFCERTAEPQRGEIGADDELPAVTERIFLYDFSDRIQAFTEAVRVFEHELAERPPHFEAYLNHVFNALLISILRKTALAEMPQTVENDKGVQMPVAVAQYLESYYTLDISLDALANQFYVNKYYLAHAFKKAYGMSPMQYLNTVRIREAMNMLQTTNHSVTAVAGMVGFVNASHFAKVFKRYTGQSPSAVKKAQYKGTAQ